MAITNTTYLGLNKPDYDAIADIEVLNDNADIIDEQFDGTHLVTKVNNVTPVDGAVNINIGVSSVNGMTGAVTITERSVKQLIDIIYPVGSYYETTNTSFNPNTAWTGTTWTRVTDGRALIAGGGSSGYTIGQTYGEKTHKITTSEMPTHKHTASSESNGAHTHSASTENVKNHTHEPGSFNITGTFRGVDQSTSGAFSRLTEEDGYLHFGGGQYKDVANIQFNASKTWTGTTAAAGAHNHDVTIARNGDHSHIITVNNSGNSTAMSLVQPSQAVARWLRTA